MSPSGYPADPPPPGCVVSMPYLTNGGTASPEGRWSAKPCGKPVVNLELGLCARHQADRERLL